MRVALSCLFVVAFATSALAAKSTKFWNLTNNTITSFMLAPAGTDKFGPDQTKNDKDASVDHDERLKIVDVPTGSYDAKFKDDKGRSCVAKGIEVKDGDIFTIEEKQATCTK